MKFRLFVSALVVLLLVGLFVVTNQNESTSEAPVVNQNELPTSGNKNFNF